MLRRLCPLLLIPLMIGLESTDACVEVDDTAMFCGTGDQSTAYPDVVVYRLRLIGA